MSVAFCFSQSGLKIFISHLRTVNINFSCQAFDFAQNYGILLLNTYMMNEELYRYLTIKNYFLNTVYKFKFKYRVALK
jgi:hypothetical protein